MPNQKLIKSIFKHVNLKVAEQAFIPGSIKSKYSVIINEEKAIIEIKNKK